MKIYKICNKKYDLTWPENFRILADKRYPKAYGSVEGILEILPAIDNISSISSSLEDYYILEGIRIVPIGDFTISGKGYSVDEDNRIQELIERIRRSKKISPLIVVVEPAGPYILEGSHRIDALYNLGYKYFPALVVINMEITAQPSQETVSKWNKIWDREEL